MSQETMEWLNQNILVGCTDKRGNVRLTKRLHLGGEVIGRRLR